MAPSHLHPQHTRTHKEDHLSAALQWERPQAPGLQRCTLPSPPRAASFPQRNHTELGSPTNPSSKHASQIAPVTPQGPLQVNKAWEEPGNKTGLVQQGQPLPSGLLGGNLWPPPCSLLPLLLTYPGPGLCSALEPTPDLVKVRQPRPGTALGLAAQISAPTPPAAMPPLLGVGDIPRWHAHGKGHQYG